MKRVKEKRKKTEKKALYFCVGLWGKKRKRNYDKEEEEEKKGLEQTLFYRLSGILINTTASFGCKYVFISEVSNNRVCILIVMGLLLVQ